MTAAFDDTVDFTVQFGFGSLPSSTDITWTSVSTSVQSVQIGRGRSHLLGRMEAGSARVVLDNRDGKFDPNNTGSTYSPNLKVATPMRIQGVHSGTTYDLFRGVVEGWPLVYPSLGMDAITTVEAVDEFKAVTALDIGGSSYAKETADTRVGNVLDDMGWDPDRRALETSNMNIAVSTGLDADSPGLAHLQKVADADAGAVFISSSGDFTFHTRFHYAGGAASQATFGTDSTDLPYQNIDLDYDDDFLWNEVRITRTGGVRQTADSTSSIDSYWKRTLTRTNEVMSDDNEASNIAVWLKDVLSEVEVRISSIELNPRSDTGLWPQVLGRDVRDAVTIKIDPPGTGTTLNQVAAIENIRHEWSRDKSWLTTWQLFPLSTAETDSYWELDSGSLSQLDTTTVLG